MWHCNLLLFYDVLVVWMGFHPLFNAIIAHLQRVLSTASDSFSVSYERYGFVCNGDTLSVRPSVALIYRAEKFILECWIPSVIYMCIR